MLNKKRNIKMIIMYDGSNYSGWQRLGKGTKTPSIQHMLEKTISYYLNEDIKIIGSGRTDAGVHALGQVANFFCHSKTSMKDMKPALNSVLPDDIRINHMEEVDAAFHSRYSAVLKTYEYRIFQGDTRSVFNKNYVFHNPVILDVKAMKNASTYLIGTHDFKAFSTDRRDDKMTVRTIEGIDINITEYRNNSYEIRIEITGDGFLYNMVRIIVGTLIEVGEGRRKIEDVKKILESKDRSIAGITVSPQGLFLLNVSY